ncbi:unnamed protein product [Candidula unifasciata]|uniref:CARD domain-containing protein n=1 Tax=Candidula unifasciata TaxID=100452 RepID=A0A8S3ZCW4_9EUPU|nr:unnamed protein product [Candidula unifasciata]
MDAKHRALLVQHKPFLIRNIVWWPELSSLLRYQGLLADSMIQDIEACNTREGKVKLMMELLPLKSGKSFQKFLDILHVSGHTFLADFLREGDEAGKLFNIQRMYKRLPFLRRAFSDVERQKIEHFISEQIDSQVLKILCQRDTKQKDTTMQIRQQLIEQAYAFEIKSKKNADTVQKLEDTINALTRENEDLKKKLSDFKVTYNEMEQKYKILLEVQTRYTEANDNEIRRVNDKILMQENNLQELTMKLHECMRMEAGLCSLHSIEETYTERDMHDLRTIKKLTLEESVDQFVMKFKNLVQIRKQYENVLEEKTTILSRFGFLDNRQGNEAVDFNSMAEINSADGSYQSKLCALGCTMWQSVIMKVMKKQLNDLRVSSRKKDSHILMLNQDLSKMRQRVSDLEKQLQECSEGKNHSRTRSGKEITIGIIPTALFSDSASNSLEAQNSFFRNSKNAVITPPAISQRSLAKPLSLTIGAESHKPVSDLKTHIINYPLSVTSQAKPWIQRSKPNSRT